MDFLRSELAHIKSQLEHSISINILLDRIVNIEILHQSKIDPGDSVRGDSKDSIRRDSNATFVCFLILTMWTSVDHRITYLQSFLCGSTAGVLGRTVTAPLDVLKITRQVKGSRTGMLSVCKQIYAMEGWRGFFRGNLSACVKIFPYYAVQVWSYKKFRWYIQDDRSADVSESVQRQRHE